MNNHSLDQLQQFAAFIEFLSRPEEHKKTLADLQTATSEYQKTLNDLRETKDFQSWRNYQLSKLDAREATLKQNQEALEAETVKTKATLAKDRDKFEQQKQAVTDKEGLVIKHLAELEKVVAMKAELAKDKEDFLARKAKFESDVEAFEAKQKAIAALMGK